jgi:hypothetical protein
MKNLRKRKKNNNRRKEAMKKMMMTCLIRKIRKRAMRMISILIDRYLRYLL